MGCEKVANNGEIGGHYNKYYMILGADATSEYGIDLYGKNVTLDLNGHSVSFGDNKKIYALKVKGDNTSGNGRINWNNWLRE